MTTPTQADHNVNDLPEDDAANNVESSAESQAFWAKMGPALSQHGRDPGAKAPGPGFLDALHRRIERENGQESGEQLAQQVTSNSVNTMPQRSSKTLWPSIWQWSGWVAAAAVLLFAVVPNMVNNYVTSPNMAYLEDGTPVPLSHLSANNQDSLVHVSEVNPNSQLVSFNQQDQLRPWLGVVTKSVKLRNFPEIDKDRGLMLVRVMPNSPAEQAGLQSGDILLSFAGCDMLSRHCIAHALEQSQLHVGDNTMISFYRHGLGFSELELTLAGLKP